MNQFCHAIAECLRLWLFWQHVHPHRLCAVSAAFEVHPSHWPQWRVCSLRLNRASTFTFSIDQRTDCLSFALSRISSICKERLLFLSCCLLLNLKFPDSPWRFFEVRHFHLLRHRIEDRLELVWVVSLGSCWKKFVIPTCTLWLGFQGSCWWISSFTMIWFLLVEPLQYRFSWFNCQQPYRYRPAISGNEVVVL